MNLIHRPILLTAALLALTAAPAQQIVMAALGTSNSTFLLGNTQALRTQCLYLPGDLVSPVAPRQTMAASCTAGPLAPPPATLAAPRGRIWASTSMAARGS